MSPIPRFYMEAEDLNLGPPAWPGQALYPLSHLPSSIRNGLKADFILLSLGKIVTGILDWMVIC